MDIIVFHSGNCGNAQNCKYPYSGIGSTPEELKKLFCYDHTFIRFKNNYRSKENFLEATVAALDNDNIIGEVTDIPLLGSAIYSRWRYFNHWALTHGRFLILSWGGNLKPITNLDC